eukprot:Nk52_evm8s2062 gene=Nk52_evmTU8s2062
MVIHNFQYEVLSAPERLQKTLVACILEHQKEESSESKRDEEARPSMKAQGEEESVAEDPKHRAIALENEKNSLKEAIAGIKEKVTELEKKQGDLESEKHLLFMTLKKVLGEDERLKQAKLKKAQQEAQLRAQQEAEVRKSKEAKMAGDSRQIPGAFGYGSSTPGTKTPMAQSPQKQYSGNATEGLYSTGVKRPRTRTPSPSPGPRYGASMYGAASSGEYGLGPGSSAMSRDRMYPHRSSLRDNFGNKGGRMQCNPYPYDGRGEARGNEYGQYGGGGYQSSSKSHHGKSWR